MTDKLDEILNKYQVKILPTSKGLASPSPASIDAKQAIEAYVTTRVKEAERLARIDELEQMSHINFVASTVVPRVSTDNRNPVKRMSDHINERYEALTTTTNGKEE